MKEEKKSNKKTGKIILFGIDISNYIEIFRRRIEEIFMKQKIYSIIGGIIFAISSAILSFQLIVKEYYTLENVIFTIITSLFCAVWVYKNTYKESYEMCKKNPIFSIVCFLVGIIVSRKLFLDKGIECHKIFENWSINPFRVEFFIVSTISLLYIMNYLGNKIKTWILNFIKELDKWDKKAYIITTIITSLVIIIAYAFNNKWFMSYDRVYSLDSGWIFKNLLPKATYYDIRHPLLNVFTFPMWAIVQTFVKIFMPGNLSNLIIAIIIQIINVQFLILIGLLLKKITNNKFVFILYIISFPTLLFTLFLEKYQLCTFFIVLYIYNVCNKKESNLSLISAAGTMPTSCFIGIVELIKSDRFINKLRQVAKIVILTILTFICLGRGHILQYGISEIKEKRNTFSNKTYTIIEKTIATSKIIPGSLIALPSKIDNVKKTYLWDGLEKNNLAISTLLIFAILCIGIIKNRKELFGKITVAWMIFSAILFMILNWSTHQTPLFAIYFSWAIIPNFVEGLDFIIEKIKGNSKLIYMILISFIIIVNATTMFDITKFLFKV